ncbi:hypothetical protein E2562_024849 [Oryza meyeriana var. granulata]|uniref:Uncharacterized protein n=1 Tax=Oryza meyeriana var. granulata TaxID=110450 RepID=A0A6G1CGQ7_9ORYZ|nr:hypothetical protein E2562_024849 [Oryza meyeriana var. granulata]
MALSTNSLTEPASDLASPPEACMLKMASSSELTSSPRAPNLEPKTTREEDPKPGAATKFFAGAENPQLV